CSRKSPGWATARPRRLPRCSSRWRSARRVPAATSRVRRHCSTPSSAPRPPNTSPGRRSRASCPCGMPTSAAWKTRWSARRSRCGTTSATTSGESTSSTKSSRRSRPSSAASARARRPPRRPARSRRNEGTPMTTHILVVDDDADLLRLLSMRLTAAGYRVTAVDSAEAALTRLAVERPQLVLSDVQLPGLDGLGLFDAIRKSHPSLPVILLTAHGTIPDAVAATSRGVYTYLTKPFDGKALLDTIAQALSLGAAEDVSTPGGSEKWRELIVSRSTRMAELLAEAKLVAASQASVLLRGESGSGKELLAQAIHQASSRAGRPFVAVNCGAIPETLLESELFGHVKGAFTGAVANHRGLFQAADGGTLLLDEIGDMPLALQVKLLRVLQERMVRPVGASQPIQVDVRIVSATHQDLEAAMAQGLFREDLYYRLNVVTLTLPTLAERREDI